MNVNKVPLNVPAQFKPFQLIIDVESAQEFAALRAIINLATGRQGASSAWHAMPESLRCGISSDVVLVTAQKIHVDLIKETK